MFTKENFKNLCKLLIFLTVQFVVIIILTKAPMEMRGFGKSFGLVSALAFCISLVPGFTKRINQLKPSAIPNSIMNISSYISFARPQIGILMFLSGLAHYLLMVVVPVIKTGKPPTVQNFFIFGLLALFLSFWLAITSNIQSKKLLKTNWKRLHSLVHIIVWLIFLHLALIEISPISVLVLLFAILDLGLVLITKFSSQKSKNV